MCSRLHPRRTALVVCLLAGISGILTAQPSNKEFAGLSGQPTAAASQPLAAAVISAAVPTPEDVGDALMAHQRYQAAIAAYRSAGPSSAEVWNKLGIAYQMMFNLTEAQRCYQESLRIDPKNTHVLNNLGTIHDLLKEYRAAERFYRRALQMNPKSALVNKNLGTNLLAQHRYEDGWAAYQAALAIDSNIFDREVSLRVDNPTTPQDRGAMNYYMAKGCVRAGLKERAIEYLRVSLNEGFASPKKIVADREFAALRGVPAFERLLAGQGSR
jgi:tetratricopeptide (TPR) repeat protein